MVERKSWREILAVHPAADLFPLMSEPELRELGEDIKKNGLQIPIVVWVRDDQDEKPKQYRLLDGRNRLDAMELVGIPFKLHWPEHYHGWVLESDCIGLDPDFINVIIQRKDPYEFVLSANIHRRHLTAEQKRALIGKLLKANPEKSDRQIAAVTKTDHKTVGTVRAEKEATGEIPQLEKTTGKDGKARKAPAKPEGNAGSKRPFRDLKTGEVVMRYRGRAGYVPMEESSFLFRALESARWARMDDLNGIEITEEIMVAARDAAAAWVELTKSLEGKYQPHSPNATSRPPNGDGLDLSAAMAESPSGRKH